MNFQTKVYVGNLPENCCLETFRSLFEKHGKVVECDIVKNYGFVHFADGEDAKLAVDKLHDTKWDGVTLKVELSYSKVRHKPGMGNKSVCYRCGKAGHWSKDCPKGPSRAPSSSSSWDNNSNNNFENRGQSSRGNRGPSINIGTSVSSGGFWGLQKKSDPFADLNANDYRLNNSFRDSYRGLFSSSSSSSPYYERNNNNTNNLSNAYSTDNNSSSSYYHNNSNNGGHRNDSTDMLGLSGGGRGDHSRNDDPCDSYPPPRRYRPYPNAHERRAPLPPLPRNTDTFIPSLLSSSSSLSHHHHHNHHYNNNHNHSESSSSSHNNSSSSSGGNFHDRDSYARPTQPSEYHERRRGGHHPSFVRLPVDETNNRESNAFVYK